MSHWWNEIPWRMVQTNLRQIDMEDMDAEAYVRELQAFHATVVLLNTAGIIASYETDLRDHFQSEYLHGDSLRAIIDRCHANGIRVIARTDFSKIRRPIYEAHPEWAYRTKAGEIVDYNGDVHACVNGGYQQEYVYQILREALTKLPLDGIFCNMSGFQTRDYSYNYYGICHCENCKRLFKAYSGGLNLPDREDLADPVYRKYRLFQRELTEKYDRRLLEFVKSINPELAVNGHDIQRMESNTELHRPLPHWQYSASSNTRCIRGLEREVAIFNTSVDFIGFYYRHVSVSPAMQELRMWQNLANLGGMDYYLIGRLDNHEDKSGYPGLRRAFAFHKAHEGLWKGLKSRAEALLLRSSLWGDAAEERGWIRALTENHILFDEALVDSLQPERLGKYKAIIAPNLKYLSPAQAGCLDEYVRAGGQLLASGETGFGDDRYEALDTPLLQCLGIRSIDYVRRDMASSMLKIGSPDASFFPSFRAVDCSVVAVGDVFCFTTPASGCRGLCSLIPPHPLGPPERCYYSQITEVPGLRLYPFGRGKGVYLPFLPGSLFLEGGYDNTAWFLRDVLLQVLGLTDVAPALTPMVEVSAAEKPGKLVVQLVNASGHFGTSFFAPLPIRDIQLRLPLDQAPADVRSLQLPDNVQWSFAAGTLRLQLSELGFHEAIEVSLSTPAG